MQESIHVFNARFETQRVDNRDDKRFGASSFAQWTRLKTIYKEQGLIQGNTMSARVMNALGASALERTICATAGNTGTM